MHGTWSLACVHVLCRQMRRTETAVDGGRLQLCVYVAGSATQTDDQDRITDITGSSGIQLG